jgi:hypothetical protein
MSARCFCGEPYCLTCGTPVDGPYTLAIACPHPEPVTGTAEWDAWLDSHPMHVRRGVGRVCVTAAEEAA